MPLVKGGAIVADEFVHLADDADIPAVGAVLIPADRFIADVGAALSRKDKTGVIWPNNRDVDELVPYLEKLAAVGLVFPIFRDGRAYTQARLLRERHEYKGELRATGQILRDQFSQQQFSRVRIRVPFVRKLRAKLDQFVIEKWRTHLETSRHARDVEFGEERVR